MNITNSQIKALLDTYNMIFFAREGFIPINDISNERIIKRFTKVLNDLLKDKIHDNEEMNNYYVSMRKELSKNETA